MVCLPALHNASSSHVHLISSHAFWPFSCFVVLLINSHTHKHTQIPRESGSIYSWIPSDLRNGGKIIFWPRTDSYWLFQRLVFVCDSHYHHKRQNLADLRHNRMGKIRRLIWKHMHMQTHTHASGLQFWVFVGKFGGKLFGWTEMMLSIRPWLMQINACLMHFAFIYKIWSTKKGFLKL